MHASNRATSWIVAVGLALSLGSIYPDAVLAQNDMDRARSAYVDYGCFQCHGYSGQGGLSGPRIAPDPIPWEAFRHYVRKPYGSMPAYSPRVLSDETLKIIRDYLGTIVQPLPLSDIPILSDRDGDI